MAPTRALFASIGASVALVAAAALSLLAVSAVFAFGGWSDPASRSVKQPALVFAGSNLAEADGPAVAVSSRPTTPIVAPAPVRRADDRRTSTARPDDVRATAPAATSVSASRRVAAPDLDAPVQRPVVKAPPAPPAPAKTGDRVRKVGESLSSTVQNTGTAVANVTEPLSPPVSAAVQQVLNAVAEIVRRTTDGLGTTLDRLLPPKQ